MTAISIPLQDIRNSYDIVVIGSGYGGGIAASRLARAGKRVCLLERGREIRPGEYPTLHSKLPENSRSTAPRNTLAPVRLCSTSAAMRT